MRTLRFCPITRLCVNSPATRCGNIVHKPLSASRRRSGYGRATSRCFCADLTNLTTLTILLCPFRTLTRRALGFVCPPPALSTCRSSPYPSHQSDPPIASLARSTLADFQRMVRIVADRKQSGLSAPRPLLTA